MLTFAILYVIITAGVWKYTKIKREREKKENGYDKKVYVQILWSCKIVVIYNNPLEN